MKGNWFQPALACPVPDTQSQFLHRVSARNVSHKFLHWLTLVKSLRSELLWYEVRIGEGHFWKVALCIAKLAFVTLGMMEMIENPDVQSTANAVRVQLNLILQDPSFRSSKRSVQFLKYVVEKTLNGQAEQIKERTIGVDVFWPESFVRHERRSCRSDGRSGVAQAPYHLLLG